MQKHFFSTHKASLDTVATEHNGVNTNRKNYRSTTTIILESYYKLLRHPRYEDANVMAHTLLLLQLTQIKTYMSAHFFAVGLTASLASLEQYKHRCGTTAV